MPLSSPGDPEQTLIPCTVHNNALAYSLQQIAWFIIFCNCTVHLHWLLPSLWLYWHIVLVLYQNSDVSKCSTPCWAWDMGSAAGLLPKHEGMCHSGHNDLIYTLALGQSDWPPTGHCGLSIGKQSNPWGPSSLWGSTCNRYGLRKEKDRKGIIMPVSNVAHRNIKK